MTFPQPSEGRHLVRDRADKQSSGFNKLVFALFRIADVPLQYQLLSHGQGVILGSQSHPFLPQAGVTGFLGLSPYRTVLLAISAVSAIKQVVWAARISQTRVSIAEAVGVGLFYALTSSINTFIFSFFATNPSEEWNLSSPRLVVGATLFVAGIALEFISEEQRKTFKDDPRNTGKVYSGGLFKWARHVNYGGWTMWRAGSAIAAGGWLYGAVVGALFALHFGKLAIPELDGYCADKVSSPPLTTNCTTVDLSFFYLV